MQHKRVWGIAAVTAAAMMAGPTLARAAPLSDATVEGPGAQSGHDADGVWQVAQRGQGGGGNRAARPSGGGNRAAARPQTRQAGTSHNVRSQAHSNINHNANRNTNVNRNNNYNRNTNVNIDRDVNIDVDRDYHGGYYHNGYHPVATAAAVTATVAVTAAVIGSVTRTLPPSCSTVVANGVSYYQCGSTWYQPQYVGSSVNYVVVNNPY